MGGIHDKIMIGQIIQWSIGQKTHNTILYDKQNRKENMKQRVNTILLCLSIELKEKLRFEKSFAYQDKKIFRL